MKEIIAVIQMDKMNKTKKALTEAGVDAFFVHEAQGRGVGFVHPHLVKGVEEGYEEAAELLGEKGKLYSKRLVTAVVEDSMVEDVVEAIISCNQTGKPGDGKIFVMPIDDGVRVRTGETGTLSIS